MCQTVKQRNALRSYCVRNGIAHEVGVYELHNDDGISAFKGLVVAAKYIFIAIVILWVIL